MDIAERLQARRYISRSRVDMTISAAGRQLLQDVRGGGAVYDPGRDAWTELIVVEDGDPLAETYETFDPPIPYRPPLG